MLSSSSVRAFSSPSADILIPRCQVADVAVVDSAMGDILCEAISLLHNTDFLPALPYRVVDSACATRNVPRPTSNGRAGRNENLLDCDWDFPP
mmetsp:Transcript_32271/g.96797  ORF Transcript_32271/g.96797 Transcript_32271/m.96797 type:complete len:93 (-) Transcript_32271:42-320(-)